MGSFKPWFILLAIFCTATLVACTAAPAPTAGAVIDQLGRTVNIKATKPERIVSLAPSNTEILFALGLGERVVGVTEYCTYPPEAQAKPKVGGFSTPNIEQIINLNPDLILAANIHKAQVIPQLEARGLTVVALSPDTVDEVLEAITLVGKVTGATKEAEKLVNDMQARIRKVTEKTAGLSPEQKRRVLEIVWHDPLMAAGAGTLHDELITMAGGINIARELSGYATISLETVIAANPEVMIADIGMGEGEDLPLQFLLTEPRLATTDARINSRVYAIDVEMVSHPGPRTADALEKLAGLIHPELFGQ
ncbi:MAG: ABC transporter substrate-binding protein [Dehalococcoidales bacterium]|nr:ABC transporter substrate-binding protein [Dehalococcoidales bacterium]